MPGEVNPVELDPVVNLERDPGLHRGVGRPGSQRPRPAGEFAKVTLGQVEGAVLVNIAHQREAGVAGDVEPSEEPLDVGPGRGLDVFHHADRGPAIRMVRRIHRLGHQPPDHPVGTIGHVLAVFVLDHVFLNPDLLVAQGREEMPHPVRLHRQGELEVGGGKVFVIVGPVRGGRAVDARPEPLERLEEVARIVLRPLEHEMLEEMGEPALASLLVLGADVVPEVHRDDGQRPLPTRDHVEAVGQRCLGETKGIEMEGWVHRSGHVRRGKGRCAVTNHHTPSTEWCLPSPRTIHRCRPLDFGVRSDSV